MTSSRPRPRQESMWQERQHVVPTAGRPGYRQRMRVLILGGNGFVGSEICRVLSGRGHAVTALARDTEKTQRRLPNVACLCRDLSGMQTASDWAFLSGFDAVVNTAGALQDSARDDVAAV